MQNEININLDTTMANKLHSPLEQLKLLALISEDFDVTLRKPTEFQRHPGRCRVLGITLTELDGAEVLLQEQGRDEPEYHPLSEIRLKTLPESDSNLSSL